ncbi:hypothetical protein [Prosthecodimorpha staleyi]|uniref:Uncharacterized protein n=1 Tax=Prosthecodimorpha staleyi TaxID=2840188 RepID=A0A947DA36_9HYPH|nr:hypothetical protein [Prosthecodimorpha staleyi]MBT9293109.1 hypothetical protein [Prosthecodimorpha staleyi]
MQKRLSPPSKTDKKKQKSRRLGVFKTLSVEKRLNPQSLRNVIYEIIKSRYDGYLEDASIDIDAARDSTVQKRRKTLINEHVLYRITNDITSIRYAHLEGIALALNVPLSLILLYSRIISNQKNDKNHENKRIINAFKAIINDIDMAINNNGVKTHQFSIQDFNRWVDIFQRENPAQKEEQLSLEIKSK